MTPSNQSLSLFAIEEQLIQLIAFAEDPDLTPEEREVAAGEIQKYVAAEVRKVDSIRGYLRHCEVMAWAARGEARRQLDNATIWENRQQRIKGYCFDAMQHAGLKKLEGNTGTLQVKGNGGVQPLQVNNESLVPEEYCDYVGRISGRMWRTVLKICAAVSAPDVSKDDVDLQRVPNNKRVREALASGPVPGAQLLERGAHLEVK